MKAIDKIKKLLSLSRSNNENEATSALSRAMKLCAENNLNIKDIQGTEDSGHIIEKNNCSKNKTRQETWEKILFGEIAEVFGCRCLITSNWRRTDKKFTGYGQLYKNYMLIGCEKDIEIAAHMFEYLRRTLKKIANKSYLDRKNYCMLMGTSEHVYKSSFLQGAVLRVTERAKLFFSQEASEQEKQEYGLVLKRGALAQRYVDNMNTKQARASSCTLDPYALREGRKAGNNIPLNKAVNGEKSTVLTLNT